MPLWEYLHVQVSDADLRRDYRDRAEARETPLQVLLNTHGSHHWELVYLGRDPRGYELVFKTPMRTDG